MGNTSEKEAGTKIVPSLALKLQVVNYNLQNYSKLQHTVNYKLQQVNYKY